MMAWEDLEGLLEVRPSLLRGVGSSWSGGGSLGGL